MDVYYYGGDGEDHTHELVVFSDVPAYGTYVGCQVCGAMDLVPNEVVDDPHVSQDACKILSYGSVTYCLEHGLRLEDGYDPARWLIVGWEPMTAEDWLALSEGSAGLANESSVSGLTKAMDGFAEAMSMTASDIDALMKMLLGTSYLCPNCGKKAWSKAHESCEAEQVHPQPTFPDDPCDYCGKPQGHPSPHDCPERHLND